MTKINKEGINFLDILRAISPDELRKKQKAIAEIAPSLQYSVVYYVDIFKNKKSMNLNFVLKS
jgi:hypothetical protein